MFTRLWAARQLVSLERRADPVWLRERSPASHERINYNLASEVVGFVEGFSELA
jgi:hypothetical protein